MIYKEALKLGPMFMVSSWKVPVGNMVEVVSKVTLQIWF